jgi:4-aminobutyrate aminotransferase-like enzyme
VDGGYHGNSNALIDISSYKFDGRGGNGRPAHVHKVPMPDVYRGPHRESDAGPRYGRYVADAARASQSLAAFFCESALGCGGQIILPPGYLAQAYAAVRGAGGVCVADEVQTGFGRVGSHFWAFETQNVVPDIVTLGKPIGNGHPLGAVVTTPEIAQSFANGMEYFNTFGGNPVSCAAGLAVLDVIRDEELQNNAAEVGGYLKHGLQQLQSNHSLIGDVRGIGLFIGLELVRDRSTLEPADREAALLVERMKECGILLSTDGLFHNVIKIKPPIIFSKADADVVLTQLNTVLQEEFPPPGI